MKIGISGDPHAKLNNIPIFQQYLIKLKELESQCDIIVILGDLFDTHAIIRSEIMNIWWDYFNKIKIPYYLLVGNHDKVSPVSNIHTLTVFKELKNITVIEPDSGIIDHNIAFVSHTSLENFKNIITPFNGNAKYLFCHQTFNGAQFDNGMYCPDGFPIDIVSIFNLVISGDIHKEQMVGNIWYLGTPYSMSFNDAGENKALWIFDTVSLAPQKILTNLSKYIVQSFQEVGGIIEWIKSQDSQNKYKIIISDTKEAIQSLQQSNEFRQLKAIYNISLNPNYTNAIKLSSQISDALSPEKMLEKYILEILPTELDKQVLLQKALSFLK
jgi:DNA repair exonuclease SbcCD nuclease subunit